MSWKVIGFTVVMFLLLILFLKYLHSHVVNSGVVKNHDTAVRTRLDVYTHIFAKFIVAAAEIVAYSLNGYI